MVEVARKRRLPRTLLRTSEDRSGPLVTCTGNPYQSTGTSSLVSTGDLHVLPVQVTNGPDRSSEVLKDHCVIQYTTSRLMHTERVNVSTSMSHAKQEKLYFHYTFIQIHNQLFGVVICVGVMGYTFITNTN